MSLGDLIGGRRVVVTGATGWLGRSLCDRLDFGQVAPGNCRGFNSKNLADLSTLPNRPTVVFHLAFPRPGARFVERAAAISGLVEAFLDSIGAEVVFYPSSGAAVRERTTAAGSYGHAKLADEARFEAWAKRTGNLLIMPRVYCLSGPHIPEGYVLAEFIRAALSGGRGPMIVTPTMSVRSYLYLPDLWEYVLSGAALGPHGADSAAWGGIVRFDACGNEEIELGDLAKRVRTVLDSSAPIERRRESGPVVRYDGAPPIRWPTGLDEQIRRTAAWLASEAR